MKLLKLLLILSLYSQVLSAQENQIKENTNVWNDLRHAWKSWWISHPSASLLDYGVFHYRKTFDLKEVPKTFVVHVSADNRYRLYVNGTFISEGPVKNDFLHWNYESVDIAPYLHPGANVIAAQVYNFRNYRQPSQFSRYTAFILQGDLADQYFVNSNETWKVYHNKAYSPIFITEQMAHGFYVTGPCDSLDAAKYPWGWEQVTFDDSAWLQASGLLGPLDWWQFMDWTDEFPNGVPPGAESGNSALISLAYVYALQRAADLFTYYGYEYEGQKYLERSELIKNGVRSFCYETERKLFAETPDKKAFSQHTNVMAVLTDMLPPMQQQELLKKIIPDISLINCSIYFKFYLMEALKKSGLGNLYISQLKVWQDMLDLGLSTFPETEPNSKSIVGARSDCHAWSASVCYDFLSIICGINPAEHGFKSVEIKPQPGYLTHIKGIMPHPEGLIEVDLNFREGHVIGIVTLPANLTGKFLWKEKLILLKAGRQEIHF